MSIRIHKVLGYGLANLNISENGEFIEDDRINPDGFYSLLEEQAEFKYSMAKFREYLNKITSKNNNRFELIMLKQEIIEGRIGSNEFNKMISWDPEYGLPNVVVFTPPSQRSWQRYDDMIDYTEACEEYQGSVPVVKPINRALYPYVSWIDIRNPTEIPPYAMIQVANEFRYNSSFVPETGDKYVKPWGFSSIDEMLNSIVPSIPDELVEILRFLEVFKDPDTIYQLRPMIYIYWA